MPSKYQELIHLANDLQLSVLRCGWGFMAMVKLAGEGQ